MTDDSQSKELKSCKRCGEEHDILFELVEYRYRDGIAAVRCRTCDYFVCAPAVRFAKNFATLAVDVWNERPTDEEVKDSQRYRWLASKMLAPDYGDNDLPGEQIGWRIDNHYAGTPGVRNQVFVAGPSINAAIDAAMQGDTPNPEA